MEHPILRDKAYSTIKQKLLQRDIRPGERIREDLLAEEISMSRTPVREAISQLTTEGFIVNLPRKGLFCASIDREEMLDFLKIREALETLAVQECIDRVTDEEIHHLDMILIDFEQALISGDRRQASEMDSQFHIAIAEISKSKKLIRFISEMSDFMSLARSKERPDLTVEEKGMSISQHQEILYAIRQRDIPKAVEAVRVNIRGMKRKLGLEAAAHISQS
jgi:DNA-binding GntR family transcriptional regulator